MENHFYWILTGLRGHEEQADLARNITHTLRSPTVEIRWVLQDSLGSRKISMERSF
jgi:hypothetical protein